MAANSSRLTTTQYVILFAFGVALWFGVAIGLRAMAAHGLLTGTARVIAYGALIPLTVPLILFLQPLAAVTRRQLLIGSAVVIGAASLCDGVALVVTPTLYGTDPAQVAGAGAIILWGVGVALLEAVWLSRAD